MSKKLLMLSILVLTAGLYWTVPLIWWNSELGVQSNSGTLLEAERPRESNMDEWWLMSGAVSYQEKGSWRTQRGPLSPTDAWRETYLRKNPLDTDNGYHPQNIFKLFRKISLTQPKQELTFIIFADHLSMSPNRNKDNGIFLYSRFQSIDDYYLAGITVDGRAVIIKRAEGRFHTLADTKLTEGEYDVWENPNLLTKGVPQFIGTHLNEEGGAVVISLYVGNELVLDARDDGKKAGPILGPAGMVGIRSDFMDVEFTRYHIEE
jgi:hypothetical protein